jgi:hypothetical protein
MGGRSIGTAVSRIRGVSFNDRSASGRVGVRQSSSTASWWPYLVSRQELANFGSPGHLEKMQMVILAGLNLRMIDLVKRLGSFMLAEGRVSP